jgi:hypothetical protein
VGYGGDWEYENRFCEAALNLKGLANATRRHGLLLFPHNAAQTRQLRSAATVARGEPAFGMWRCGDGVWLVYSVFETNSSPSHGGT